MIKQERGRAARKAQRDGAARIALKLKRAGGKGVMVKIMDSSNIGVAFELITSEGHLVLAWIYSDDASGQFTRAAMAAAKKLGARA